MAASGHDRAPAPRPLLRAATWSGCLLAVAVLLWGVAAALLSVRLVTFSMAVALLLTALLWPSARALRRRDTPPGVAAAVCLVGLLAALGLAGWLVGTRVEQLTTELVPALTAAVDDLRSWLVEGPLGLDPGQVQETRDRVVTSLVDAVPSPTAIATLTLDLLSALALALFAVFFFLKDGPRMWAWVLERVPERGTRRTDAVGRAAWATLTSYCGGVVVVAVLDAVLIGTGLLLLGVPQWLPLSLLVFVGAFVPLIGATLTGVVAVAVTLVTEGFTAALVATAVVLVVQQVEGNLLQPLVMGRAVQLHPVVTLVSVTCGLLLLGIPGAVVAVPLVAVAYRACEVLRADTARTSSSSGATDA